MPKFSKDSFQGYLVWLLIAMIGVFQLWNTNTVACFRDDYVTINRYETDQGRIEKKLDLLLDLAIGKK